MSDGGEDFRKCYRCGESKPTEAFATRRRKLGQLDSFCRPCRKAYGREHYLANRARYIEQARVQKQRLQLERTMYLIEYFVTHPCLDCGESDPVVLEFDHLRDKVFDIGQGLARRRWAAVLAEIEKCGWYAPTATADARHDDGARSARC